jgi:hypothetical protein
VTAAHRTLEARHLDVENRQLRPESLDLLHRIETVVRFGDDFDVRVTLEHARQSRARGCLVVDDEVSHATAVASDHVTSSERARIGGISLGRPHERSRHALRR